MTNTTHRFVAATAADFRRLAEQRLPRFLFDYVDGGANDEISLARNVSDLRQWQIRQRVLRNVDHIDTSTRLAGQAAQMPLVLAPVGMAGMMARRGEVLATRAAAQAGIPFTLSTVGICPLAEVAAAAPTPPWFQLYMMRDRDRVRQLLQQALAVGCTTLVFTVDLPMPGLRHRDTRNGLMAAGWLGKRAKVQQLLTRPAWVLDVALRGKPLSFGNLAGAVANANDLNAYKAWVDAQFDPTVTWDDIRWLRDLWPGQLLLKGIMEVDDARQALAVGANGLVVSNHGGRQLDSVPSTISALPAIAQAVGQHMQVYQDGGVRSGVDMFKALALGAHGVLIGRPWVWALAGAGQAGLSQLLATWRQELSVTMALAGVTRITDITADALLPATGGL